MRLSMLTLVLLAVLLVGPIPAFADSITIPATVVIWLGGQPSGTTFWDSVAPTDSAIAINLSVFRQEFLTFNVTGATSRDLNLANYPLVGGDGETPGTGPLADNFYYGPDFSFSGLRSPFSSLIGVFVDLDHTYNTPTLLDFWTPEARSFSNSFASDTANVLYWRWPNGRRHRRDSAISYSSGG